VSEASGNLIMHSEGFV